MKKSLSRLKHQLTLHANRLLGRSFIPNPTETLYLEPSSICNLKCRFCAYAKKHSPKCLMPHDFFCRCIEQAVELGYDSFGLTPITGEIFTDPDLFAKLDFLEHHPGVTDYHFFTNFILLDELALEKLLALRKLSLLSLSIYGHDQTSFTALTGSTPAVYLKLLRNLNCLLAHYKTIPSPNHKLEIGWRTQRSFDFETAPAGDLVNLLRLFRDETDTAVFISKGYNNWGGLITPDDIQDLDITLSDEKDIYKLGPCALIFYKLQITADGRVNACACRDVNATLCLGDLKQSSLQHILSADNPSRMQLIHDQQQGRFTPICRACDMYRSIYKYHGVYHYHTKPPITLTQFLHQLPRCPQPRSRTPKTVMANT